MKQTLLILLICLFIDINSLDAQCKIYLPKECVEYSGNCVNGKAEGDSKAIGIDTFVGHYKAGYPDGFGRYSYANGDVYTGYFKKGKKFGKGTFVIKNAGANNTDSIIDGYWKDNIFNGKFSHPFKIISKSGYIKETSFSRDPVSSINQITLIVTSDNAGQQSISFVIPKPQLRSINIQEGSYQILNSAETQVTKNEYYLLNVIYPFKAVFNIDEEQLEVEILEPGNWKIFTKLRFKDL